MDSEYQHVMEDHQHVNVKSECLKGIKAWAECGVGDLEVSVVGGGLTNLLYKCKLTGPKAQGDVEPKVVLVRYFGKGTEELIDKKVEQTVFETLATSGIGPKLHFCFDGGRIEEFVNAPSVPYVRFGDDFTLQKKVLKEVLRLHYSKDFDSHFERRPRIMEAVRQNVKICLSADYVPEHLMKKVKYVASLLDKLEEAVKSVDSPVVFCHNDVNEGNILYDEDNNIIQLIDFEYAMFNYRGYEFANWFMEIVVDNAYHDPPYFKVNSDRFPSVDKQRALFKEYLELANEPADDAAIDHMVNEVRPFVAVSNALWGAWGAVNICQTDIDFDYAAYALARLECFEESIKGVISL